MSLHHPAPINCCLWESCALMTKGMNTLRTNCMYYLLNWCCFCCCSIKRFFPSRQRGPQNYIPFHPSVSLTKKRFHIFEFSVKHYYSLPSRYNVVNEENDHEPLLTVCGLLLLKEKLLEWE